MPAGNETSLLRRSAPSTGKRSDRGGRRERDVDPEALERVGIRLRPEQREALEREAHHRALVRASLVTDKSEIVREALDAWLAGRS